MRNVLLTSAGRRVSLLRAFGEAAHDQGGKIFAGDMSPLAPSLFLAEEAFRLPPLTAPDYVAQLLNLVVDNSVGLVVPTIDTELPVLAAHAARFADIGSRALVSSTSFVEIAGDKWLTSQEFGNYGLSGPVSWLPGSYAVEDLPDRLFVKPRNGSSSIDTHRSTPLELDGVLAKVPNPIVQEELGGPEITIDALIDFDGTPLHYVPRTRLRALAGESIQGVTIDDCEIREWLVRLINAAAALGARGPITCQAFLTASGPVLIDVNPRFGGGFPLAHAAGGRYPEWILALLSGESVEPRLGEYERGLYMTRYNTEHFTREPPW